MQDQKVKNESTSVSGDVLNEQESLTDLELAEEQADTTKAGTGTHAAGGGGGAGKVSFQDLHFVTS